jgi:REP element-mobilizing transposase RayT
MASGLQLKPTDAANQTFQVTSRGVGTIKPFLRNIDKREFLGRLSWYLSPTVTKDAKRRPYLPLFEEVAVLAYCVLDNHFHLIVHQYSADGMRKLMTRVLGGYGKYYNREHRWKGPVFDGRYAADPVRNPDHMREMLGYAILNDPIGQLGNEFCSNAIHLGERNSHWVRNDLTMKVFGGVDGYRSYMNRTGPTRVESKLRRWGIDPAIHPYRPI